MSYEPSYLASSSALHYNWFGCFFLHLLIFAHAYHSVIPLIASISTVHLHLIALPVFVYVSFIVFICLICLILIQLSVYLCHPFHCTHTCPSFVSFLSCASVSYSSLIHCLCLITLHISFISLLRHFSSYHSIPYESLSKFNLVFFQMFWSMIIIFFFTDHLLFLRVYVSITIMWCCSLPILWKFEIWTQLSHLSFNRFRCHLDGE